VTLVFRLHLQRLARLPAPPGRPPNTLRYRRPWQMLGLVWAALCAALVCDCLVAGDDVTLLVAVTVVAGICGGIASRNASTPRYAVGLLAMLLAPCITIEAWLGHSYWYIAVLTTIYLLALASIVRQQYNDIRALIDAEQRSRLAQAALRASEEMLQLSMNVGRIGSYRRDYRTGLVQCGPQTRLMHGLPAGDAAMTFAAFSENILPEDHARARKDFVEFGYRLRGTPDEVRHIEARCRIEYDEAGLPLSCVGVMTDVTERWQAQARIAHLAHHDPLTALPNRTLFGIRLDEAVARARRGELFALLCLDLDRFKEVNDTLGHPVGDALLQAVTERLNAAIRPSDTAARLGGDEFALIQTRLERPDDAIALAERLLAVLQLPFELDGHHVVIGASIGIALAPDDGTDPEALMRRADMALYSAKAEGRGCYRLFERHMDADLQARRTLELDLRQALEQNEFELFYQPVVDVGSRRVCGFEALLRWHHPTRGLVSPDRFIPLVEATGLVLPIGAWVLRQACAEAAGWSNGARIAVNLSAVQFAGATLVATVADALRQSGLDPRRLELEITETTMLQDTEATLATLHELRALGLTIAMDDFGTGYSSLGYLQRFPFDKVKIDRSFTSELGERRETAAIVGSVIDLCHNLEMRTTAEGVETASQFATLAQIGCQEVQGYFFSPPRPAGEIPAMIMRIESKAVAVVKV
jgi:diguanylate cyclase (GGDEF)-like protein